MSSNRPHKAWCVHPAIATIVTGLAAFGACFLPVPIWVSWLIALPVAVVCGLLSDGPGNFTATPFLQLKTEDGGNYLTRWCLICTPYFRVYLHSIEAPDYAREVHNHPAEWWCFVLRGGYTQHLLRPLFQYVPTTHNGKFARLGVPLMDYTGKHQAQRWVERIDWLRWNHMTTDVYHRIASVKPHTWTLCFFGAVDKRRWGFWCNGKHVDSAEYRAWKAA
jgi:hypothetical protein